MRIFLLTVFALAFSVVTIHEASAFTFVPFRAKFEPSGANANRLFTVDNNTNEPATVQIRIMHRDLDLDGHETDIPAENDFIIYPAQMVLKPHTKRSVRVQWVGPPSLKEEKVYRIIAEQLPVNLDKTHPRKSSVKFLVSYHGALFVTPPGLSHNVKLDFVGTTTVKDKKVLDIVLHNRGNMHAMLRNLELRITDSKSNTVTLTGEDQLKGMLGETILGKHRRQFILPFPENLTGKVTKVDFTFDKRSF